MLYDLKKIQENVTMFDVLDYYEIEQVRKNKNVFIRCPVHELRIGCKDKNIGNCIATKKYFKCYSCGAKDNIFEFVMEIENVNFVEACRILISINDYDEKEYSINGDYSTLYMDRPLLRNDELAMIGLKPDFDKVRNIVNVGNKDENTIFFQNEYVKCVYSSYPKLSELWSSDKKTYLNIVKGKIDESIINWISILNELDRYSPNFNLYKETFDIKTDKDLYMIKKQIMSNLNSILSIKKKVMAA